MPNPTRNLDGLQIHVLAWRHGAHDTPDPQLLDPALRAAGAKVIRTQVNAGGRHAGEMRASGMRLLRSMDWAHGKQSEPRFDVSLHVGQVSRSWFGLARRNLLLAQSAWSMPTARHLEGIDGVLCPVAIVQETFAQLDCATAYIGWSSRDCLQTQVPRQRGFFHRASRATAVSTRCLLALWQCHPEWPCLTVLVDDATSVAEPQPCANIHYIGGGVDAAERVRLQNANRFHICLSADGGGSGDLGEALSVGAVTLSVLGDAADVPRDDHHGILVPARAGAIATRQVAPLFDEAAMEMAIERVMAMGDSAVQAVSAHARAWFQRNHQRYGHDLAHGIDKLCAFDQPPSASRDISAAANAAR